MQHPMCLPCINSNSNELNYCTIQLLLIAYESKNLSDTGAMTSSKGGIHKRIRPVQGNNASCDFIYHNFIMQCHDTHFGLSGLNRFGSNVSGSSKFSARRQAAKASVYSIIICILGYVVSNISVENSGLSV